MKSLYDQIVEAIKISNRTTTGYIMITGRGGCRDFIRMFVKEWTGRNTYNFKDVLFLFRKGIIEKRGDTFKIDTKLC